MTHFKDILSLESLHDFTREEGFNRPTAVQSAVIPRMLKGTSVSVLAQTGTGKTLAYALPIAELLKKLESDTAEAEVQNAAPRAWILVPTRELAAQVEGVFKAIAHRAKLRVRHLWGSDRSKHSRAVLRGPIDVLISSPNRALRAVKAGSLRADAARLIIFDEADQLFDHSFLPDVQALFSRLDSGNLQVGLFSATMPNSFAQLRRDSFPRVVFDELRLQGSHTLKDNISTENFTVPFKAKLQHAVRLLEQTRGHGFVFVNLKRVAEQLFSELSEALPTKKFQLLHGGTDKRQRRKVLARFADDGDVLVCTDIAARGLDLPGANWLINYDLPFEAVYYVHRCGRIGRTGEPAQVYNLVTTKDRELINRINKAIANQASVKLSRVSVRREAPAKKAETTRRGGKPGARTPSRGKGAPGTRTDGRRSDGLRGTGKPTAAKRSTARPTGGKRAAAKPAAAKRSSARPTGAKRSAAKLAGAKRSAAKRAGAKRSAAKTGGTKRPTRKSPSRSPRSSSGRSSPKRR